jgi:hypothetical protein
MKLCVEQGDEFVAAICVALYAQLHAGGCRKERKEGRVNELVDAPFSDVLQNFNTDGR